MSAETLAVVVDALIALAVIGAATALLALGKIDATTGISLFGVSVTLIGGSAKSLLALRVPAPAAPRPAAAPAASPLSPPAQS